MASIELTFSLLTKFWIMKTKVQTFEGINIYVGIDVHFKSWKIAPFTNDTALKKFTLSPPSPSKLADSLYKRYPKANFICCYEAGFSGFWIQRQLENLGLSTHIVNAADIPTTNKELRRKEDARDASKIGRQLRAKSLDFIFIPSKKQESDRSVLRFREQLIKDERRVKQRIKMHCHFVGLAEFISNTTWSQKSIDELISLANKLDEEYLKQSLHQLIQLRNCKKNITKKIKELSCSGHYGQLSYLLQSIPGISQLGSMILITEIMDMKRFSSMDKLCSYIGLVPDTHHSSDTLKDRGITKRKNRRLRTILIEAAWIAIRYDPALTIAYSKYKKKTIGQKAIVKIARKLLARIRFVWLNKQPYVIGLN